MSAPFLGNCLIVALWHRMTTRNTRIRYMRNRCGRWHFYWETNGFKYEFYTPGASQRSYWRNALTRGVVRRVFELEKGGSS